MTRRVVITGCGGLTALGHDWGSIREQMRAHQSGIKHMAQWDEFPEMNTRLGAPVANFDLPAHYNRKTMRSMGLVAQYATYASELALDDAGLLNNTLLKDANTGVAYGSSGGSAAPIAAFGRMLDTHSMKGITSNSYVQMMGHTTAVNIGLFFKLTGRIIPTSSACTSGSQGIGYAYESICSGNQDIMIAGGAEEVSAVAAAVFDTLFATSTKNDAPQTTPQPFDRDRDGLVIGGGATSLILEDLEHAQARGARIYAEVLGYGTNSDGTHITQPNAATMAQAMQQALTNAKLEPDAIDYVSAHGTATDRGDIAETQATQQVLGKNVPISSMKSYFGHTLGACGALESWLAIEMMRDGWFAPTLNLNNLDPECGELDYIMGDGREIEANIIMNNNFAFGGINTSLIFKRW
ncbi:MAG TPA: beta-ketoacyl-ACP synthase [Gammaproteobacteria bacterium]|nr:beta-ketoacyl-ACP synthase [Gammaproteobacteria bacterium]